METKNEPAQLAVQQTTQAQVPVSQPVILSPGQQLVYPPGQAVPVAGQPMYVQAVPGQPPMQYQMPASGQAPPGQNAPGQQPVQYQMPAGGSTGQYPPGQVVYMQQQQQPGFNLTMDFSYIKSQPGIFKCIEFVILLIAFATALKFKEVYTPSTNQKQETFTDEILEFFLGATISGWVMCILIVFAFVFGLNKSCGVPSNAIVLVAVFHMAWVIMLGGGSGALAYRTHQIVDGFQKTGVSLSQIIEPLKTQINCLFVAMAFGFLSFILFIVDAILQFKIYTAMKVPTQFTGVMVAQQPLGQPHPGAQ